MRKKYQNASWGLVPTMGYLHEGHMSLVELARSGNEKVGVTIFVNPTQFAPEEDLDSYPRDLERDLALLRKAGVDLVLVPDNNEMYPPGFQTSVELAQITKPLEGNSRPTHFSGVATIVAKLFNIFQPSAAYFGQKDVQQTIVIKKMVRDLNFDLQIIIGPTVRESDGLALSSRNAYLDAEERAAATVLYRALTAAEQAVLEGQTDGDELRRLMRKIIEAEPLAMLDYISASDPNTMLELDTVGRDVLLSTAVFFGRTRLIDNILVTVQTQ